jgi:hypothetical protein
VDVTIRETKVAEDRCLILPHSVHIEKCVIPTEASHAASQGILTAPTTHRTDVIPVFDVTPMAVLSESLND